MTDIDPTRLPYRPCVGVMLLNARGQVWVGRRTDHETDAEGPGNWWQMPQGGVDEGEDPRTAASRELFEETNVTSAEIVAETPGWLTYDLPPDLIGISWKGRYRGQKQRWFALRFTGEESEIDVASPGGGHHKPEFDEWRWAEMDSLPGLVVPFKRGVYEQVVQAFHHLVA
ncbi:MAG: RNA pyrophosphohydrolase [Rhodobiaceae bacterium]|nr:RNA pyrophosphohydrolase [Rhodobiaceae bacterium]MCC0041169.1 RNA pyrophosphohydrolase [Rhodobiaceae bacterium]